MQRKKLLALILAFSAVIGTVCVTGCSKNSGTVDTNKQPKVNVLNCIDEVFGDNPESVRIRYMNKTSTMSEVPLLLAEVNEVIGEETCRTTLYDFFKSVNLTYYDFDKYQLSRFPGLAMMLGGVEYGVDFADEQENTVRININADGKLYIIVSSSVSSSTQYYNAYFDETNMQIFREYFNGLIDHIYE